MPLVVLLPGPNNYLPMPLVVLLPGPNNYLPMPLVVLLPGPNNYRKSYYQFSKCTRSNVYVVWTLTQTKDPHAYIIYGYSLY